MSNAVDPIPIPITTSDDWCAADARQDAIRVELDRPDDHDVFDRLAEKHVAITEATQASPTGWLLRACWIAVHWEQSIIDPRFDANGVVNSFDVTYRDDGEPITTAGEIRWLVETLVAELRRLRPELAPSDAA